MAYFDVFPYDMGSIFTDRSYSGYTNYQATHHRRFSL